MTDNGNNNQKQAPYVYANVPPRGNETALMIEGFYNGLAYDLQKMKKELMNELKYTTMQNSAVYQSIQKETTAANESNSQIAQSMVQELKFGYQQNQMIFESLSAILTDDVVSRLDTIEGKTELLESVDKLLDEVKEKLETLISRPEPDYNELAELIKDKVVNSLPVQEEPDYDRITESLTEKTESSINGQKNEILAAVAAIPVAENIDYLRIVEEVGEKVNEKLEEKIQNFHSVHPQLAKTAVETKAEKVDYDRIIYGAAEKVIESLPFPEKIDYRRINESFVQAANAVKIPGVDEEKLTKDISDVINNALAGLDVNQIADIVAAKVVESIVIPQPEEINYEKIADSVVAQLPEPEAIDYDKLADTVISRLPEPEAIDYDKLADAVISRLPEPETIDYDKLADVVISRLPEPEAVDYDKLADVVATRMPISEAMDYAFMAQSITDRMPAPRIATEIDYDRVCQAAQAAQIIPDPIDYDRIADLVEDKLAAISQPETFDYDLISDRVAEKIVIPEAEVVQPEEIDYDLISEKVAEKISNSEKDSSTYDVVVDEDGAKSIAECVANAIDFNLVAEKLSEKVTLPVPEIVLPEQEQPDYEEIANKIVEKLDLSTKNTDNEELSNIISNKITSSSFDIVIDKAGADIIAEAVVDRLRESNIATVVAGSEEDETENPVSEDVVENIVDNNEQAVVEEVAVADSTAEIVEEEPVETTESVETEEPDEVKEVVAGNEEELDLQDLQNNLVDADSGIVIRLKKSFTAKLKQSDEVVKQYYSDIKNELVSYKRLNSNISWHGDRFNYGRDTVAKLNIVGKSLCLYLALDPTDPEYKTTVYHQRDLSAQKSYENTPFMVKIKSNAALKKAIRLIGYLAEKLEAEKDDKFENIDYIEQFGYESTKKLLEDGLIRVTKEKKVVLDFN